MKINDLNLSMNNDIVFYALPHLFDVSGMNHVEMTVPHIDNNVFLVIAQSVSGFYMCLPQIAQRFVHAMAITNRAPVPYYFILQAFEDTPKLHGCFKCIVSDGGIQHPQKLPDLWSGFFLVVYLIVCV